MSRAPYWLGLAGLITGLLLFVRVIFFGVQQRIDDERLVHRKWPLSLAAFLMVAGAVLYARGDASTASWVFAASASGLGAAIGAWWWVKRSEAAPSTDPEDDPRFRFQGHVARVVEAIEDARGGRIVFDFDGRRHDFRALWSPSAPDTGRARGVVGTEVVIETVEGDVAYVEPWAIVEERL